LVGIKVNSDGATKCALSFAACGGIFKGNSGEYVSSCYAFLGIQHFLY